MFMCSPGISLLCNFLQHNSNLIRDTDANGITKEKERELLLLLSKVCRHLGEVGDDAGEEHGINNLIGDVHGLTFCRQGEDTTAHSCMEFVTEMLVLLMLSENDFICHSAGKALYVLSSYLMELLSEWRKFIDQLWISLKGICFHLDIQPINDVTNQPHAYADDGRSSKSGAIDTKAACHIVYLAEEIECLDSSIDSASLKKSCIAASRLMELLRKILKNCYLKTEKLVNKYLDVTETHIMDVAQFLSSKLFLADTAFPGNFSCESSSASLSKGCHYVEKELVLGSLLQILCSVVHNISSKYGEGGGTSLNQWPLLIEINELIPALSVQCLALHNHLGHCISDFLRHKLMNLMISLSDCFVEKPFFFVLWLDLLWEHAADLLCHPLPENKTNEYSLVGSPFWNSSDHHNREVDICKSHLQSRAMFLLFKCSFILIRKDVRTSTATSSCHGSSLETKYESSFNQPNPIGESGHQKGVAALKNWLLRQTSCLSALSGDVSGNRRNTFTLSFLQLFMDEDDLMFEMLLQLLDMPLFLQQELCHRNNLLDNERCMDTCLLILESLKPTFLFHEFLAAIQYDHLVIVDYLISKCTGTLSLRYLLRSLRVLSESWQDFIGSSTDTRDPRLLSCKRVRHQLELKEPEPSTISTMSDSLAVGSDTYHITEPSKDGLELVQTIFKRKGDTEFLPMSMIVVDKSKLESAKRCLSLLHVHIESLHKKDLFPYNPSPLLKRLEKFLQVCNARRGV